MQNDGPYGCYYGFRAILLHTFGVKVRFTSLSPAASQAS